MDNDYLLYTLPQWAIFSGITVMIYGWVEKKEVFERIGLGIFIILGFFAVYIFSSGLLIPEKYLTPEEFALPDEYLPAEDISTNGKLIPVYKGIILMSFFAAISLILKFIKKGRARLFLIISGVIALVVFFLIVGALKS